MMRVDPVDAARAQEYALLAALLSYAPSNALLGEIARLQGDVTPLGRAHAALAEAAAMADDAKSSANISICSSVSRAANCCPTRPTI